MFLNNIININHKILGNVFVKQGTYDSNIVQEVTRSYSCLNLKNKCVLDVGGHIGSFCIFANKMGANKILSFEPDVTNYSILKMNTINLKNVKSVNAALIPNDEKEISFYKTTSGKNSGNYSILHFNGREEVKVKAKNFFKILEVHRPDVIKMDCEGAEYELLTKPLPSFVKQIVVERHFNKNIFRTQIKDVIKLFNSWDVLIPPKYTDKSWFCLGAWKRK